MPLSMVTVHCCVCQSDDAEPVAVGEDFEYHTSPDSFLAYRCRDCGLVYVSPRPSLNELSRIYPPSYHAFNFSPEDYGFVYKVRRRLEARRLLSCCRDLPETARILDVGCGDGFHMSLLRDFGKRGWTVEGVDSSDLAVEVGARTGLKIHKGFVQKLDLPNCAYDLALLIATLEHVDDPPGVLSAIRALLKPGGRVMLVTDNTGTLDFRIFKHRHWGGYHFPRHWNLFNAATLRTLAAQVGLEVETISTIISPVNWVYSIRNTLVDWNAPPWLANRFSLKASGALAIFTMFDSLHQIAGRGALLRAVLKRPI